MVSHPVRFSRGQPICFQGEAAECMYVLRAGVIGIYSNTNVPSGVPCSEPGVKIAEFDSIGAIIGEAGLFLHHRTASLLSLSDDTEVELVPFGTGGVEQMIQRNPKIGITLCRSLAGRLKGLSHKVGEASLATISMQTTYHSLAVKYLTLVERLCRRAENQGDAECLKRHPLFRKGMELKARQNDSHEVFQNALSRNRAGSLTLEMGRVLCQEGDIGRSLYLIQEGEIEVLVGGRSIAVIEAGELIGEIAVLLSEVPKRTATLRALTDCRLVCIPASDFATVSEQRPSLLVTIAHMLSGRINRTNRIASNIRSVLWEELSLLAKSPKSCEAAFTEIVTSFSADSGIVIEAESCKKRSIQVFEEMQVVCKGLTLL